MKSIIWFIVFFYFFFKHLHDKAQSKQAREASARKFDRELEESKEMIEIILKTESLSFLRQEIMSRNGQRYPPYLVYDRLIEKGWTLEKLRDLYREAEKEDEGKKMIEIILKTESLSFLKSEIINRNGYKYRPDVAYDLLMAKGWTLQKLQNYCQEEEGQKIIEIILKMESLSFLKHEIVSTKGHKYSPIYVYNRLTNKGWSLKKLQNYCE